MGGRPPQLNPFRGFDEGRGGGDPATDLECSSDYGSGVDVGGPACERTAMKWSGPGQDTRDPSRARSGSEWMKNPELVERVAGEAVIATRGREAVSTNLWSDRTRPAII